MKKALVLLAAGACAVLLFAGGSGRYSPRYMRHAWDFGHVICFALWGRIVLERWVMAGRPGFWPAAAAVLGFALVVGGGVELVQGVFRRSPDLGDLGYDLVGGLLALAFFPWNPRLSRFGGFGLKTVAVVLGLFCLYPAAHALTDDILARRSFPVLADFETPCELDRWEGTSHRSIVGGLSAHGRAAMRIELVPGKYSGASLRHPVADWRGYQALVFSIFNPSDIPLSLVCRIDDRLHGERGYRYRDRFNRTFMAEPGWTEVSIALDEVARAPEGRLMDLGLIEGWLVFARDVESRQVIYLDHLRLVK